MMQVSEKCAQRPAHRLPGLRAPILGVTPEVALNHAFIEFGQVRAASCDPTHEIADQTEAPPCALASEPRLGEARGVKLNELAVRLIPQTPVEPASAQVLLCNHRPLLRC